jgi:hypothetical protein
MVRHYGGDVLLRELNPPRKRGRPPGSTPNRDEVYLEFLEVLCRVAKRDHRMGRPKVIRLFLNGMNFKGANPDAIVERLRLKLMRFSKVPTDISRYRFDIPVNVYGERIYGQPVGLTIQMTPTELEAHLKRMLAPTPPRTL